MTATTAPQIPATAPATAWRLTNATEHKVSALRTTARSYLRTTLATQGRTHDPDALFGPELVLAELVTNAMRHGGTGEIDILIAVEAPHIWIAVTDTNGGAKPEINPAAPGTLTRGQGMRLVDALTCAWDTITLGDGKLVTAVCPVPDLDQSLPQPAIAHQQPAPTPSLTPSHDGMAWLTRACPVDARASLAAGWNRGENSPIPVGAEFDAVAVNAEHVGAVLDHLGTYGLTPGPVLAHYPPTGPDTAYFLVPPGSRWPDIEGTHTVAEGRTLLCPRPGSTSNERMWLVPPDGSGHLTDPGHLADALTTAIAPASIPDPAVLPASTAGRRP
ncbi:ATP-binding protein [Kitasatospora sp. NPDC086791]|uniref:ATP-binding protein n=1 Tax=Kitasatospora sp. NPDC086791 TaxID=3155178 RepID=UPI003436195C